MLGMMLFALNDAAAAIDLRNAAVERLDNGLTVILLEDRNFPVVSTQMLYRVGARNESYGQTGLAHFLEHMAFRDSEKFPDTGLVSSIYAAGGEWHGYTWTDQTTYFATVPKDQLDLLLRIEADRLSHLCISKDAMDAERGAVLAEMHMYENYPTSMLLDALIFTSFLAHPYRNNTIGWESDIEYLEHREVVSFYERHYQPTNAVLAVVGDFDRRKVRARIEELFGDVEGKPPTPLPRTVEPVQEGERRVRLHAETDVKRFMIGWRAPSANHADFAAFLVLQEVLGGGSGVNFLQNDWGTPLDDHALLEGVGDDLTTWYPPSAQDYIFIVGGTIAADGDENRLEEAVEERLRMARSEAPDQHTVQAAVERVLDELVYDVETTEDAAHQLAFFDGLGALEALLSLPQRVAKVSAPDVQRVASNWLLPERRTVGWHVPGNRSDDEPGTRGNVARETGARSQPAAPGAGTRSAAPPPDAEPVPQPEIRELSGGIPVIVQSSDLSESAHLQIVLPGSNVDGDGVQADDPVTGHSSLAWRFRPDELQETVATAREAAAAARAGAAEPEAAPADPETVIEQVFSSRMKIGSDPGTNGALSPALIVVTGDLDVEGTFAALEKSFGKLDASARKRPMRAGAAGSDIEVNLQRPVAQAQLGYMVPAPGPREETSLAYRILLYILSHDYEGRLGKEAISNRGLAYYIDSRYRSDGENGWVTLAVGVDPDKLEALKELMKAELGRLRDEPPAPGEIEEAKRHLVGRARSAAQSNRELAAALAETWLWYGDTLTPDALARKLAAITRQEVIEVVPAFIDGSLVVVDHKPVRSVIEATAAKRP